MKEENAQNVFLAIHNLEKVYPDGEKAVYNFNLDIEKNEFIVIVGPSGCGKSTTLRMIAGLEDITSGDVYMDNQLLNYKACKDRKMAIVFQSYALYPQMNVFDNIAFPLTINTYPFPAVNTKLRAAKELECLFGTVTAETVMDALYVCHHDREQRKNAAENLAVCLNVSVEAAEWLAAMYRPLKKYAQQELKRRADEIREGLLSQIRQGREKEARAAAERGVVMNDCFCELDTEGREKAVFRKMTAHEIRTKVYETAAVLDLTPYLDKLPKELSGGQMQRVALGRAIVKNVPVFLMDEPLSNLDAKLRLTMRSEIVKLHNRINATTIYVTHDQTEAMTMATRIVVMSRGFVQQIGTPEEIYKHPVNIFVAKFIGAPSMNLFGMRYDKASGLLRNNDVEIPVKPEFARRYEAYYKAKTALFTRMLENFGEKEGEAVRKILSTLDRPKNTRQNKKEKRFLKSIGKAKKEPLESLAEEREEAVRILEELAVYQKGSRELLVGIRPERIRIEKYCEDKMYVGGIRLKPTVCELLGAEYNVHFDYCGRSMVGKVDEKERISTKDEIVVTLSFEDIYIFDPVTGDVI